MPRYASIGKVIDLADEVTLKHYIMAITELGWGDSIKTYAKDNKASVYGSIINFTQGDGVEYDFLKCDRERRKNRGITIVK